MIKVIFWSGVTATHVPLETKDGMLFISGSPVDPSKIQEIHITVGDKTISFIDYATMSWKIGR